MSSPICASWHLCQKTEDRTCHQHNLAAYCIYTPSVLYRTIHLVVLFLYLTRYLAHPFGTNDSMAVLTKAPFVLCIHALPVPFVLRLHLDFSPLQRSQDRLWLLELHRYYPSSLIFSLCCCCCHQHPLISTTMLIYIIFAACCLESNCWHTVCIWRVVFLLCVLVLDSKWSQTNVCQPSAGRVVFLHS